MESFNLLPGKIKRIESITTTKKNSTIRVVEGIIIDYIYDSNAKESMKHKLECVTLNGDSSIIYINKNSNILDIEVDDNTKDCLNSIRKSILNKREATKTISRERANIEELTVRLLTGVNAINREDFINTLISKLDDFTDCLKYNISKHNSNYAVDVKLDSLEISFTAKKHFISNIKIRGFVNTNSTTYEIDEIKDKGIFVNKEEFVSEKCKQVFLDKYGVSNIFNSAYYDFIERNKLSIEDTSYCCSNYSCLVKYKIAHAISSKESGKLFLNNENIKLIIDLINILKSK